MCMRIETLLQVDNVRGGEALTFLQEPEKESGVIAIWS